MYICWGIMTPFYKGRKWLICFINILLLRHLITVCLLKYGKMLNVTNYKFDLYFILHTLYSKSNGRIKWWIMFVSSGLYQCLVGTEWINSDVLEIYWFLGCIFFVWFLTKCYWKCFFNGRADFHRVGQGTNCWKLHSWRTSCWRLQSCIGLQLV